MQSFISLRRTRLRPPRGPAPPPVARGRSAPRQVTALASTCRHRVTSNVCVRCTHVCNLASLRFHRSTPACEGSAHRRTGRPGIRSPNSIVKVRVRIVERLTDGSSGGAAGTRTPDLRRAKAALSQLSYGPICDHPAHLSRGAAVLPRSGGRAWTRTRDLGLIRAAL